MEMKIEPDRSMNIRREYEFFKINSRYVDTYTKFQLDISYPLEIKNW